jgi:ketosteroid isomerase-like protein
MKKNMVNGVMIVSVITLLFACNTKVEEPAPVVVDKEAIKSEIQARENEYADLYNRGEIKKIGYYAEDAITFYQNKKPLQNFAEREAFLKADLESNTNQISFTTTEVFPSSDGIQVVEIGHYIVTDSSKKVINTGNYMSLFEKRNGKYVCLRDMSASDMPVE